MVSQLVREWPPGFGGVERVAHALAGAFRRIDPAAGVFSLQGPRSEGPPDPLPVTYRRRCLPRLACGQLLLPLPGRVLLGLLSASDPLHVHLPCPALLLLSVLARLRHPRRRISLHWHAFLEPSPGAKGLLTAVYQALALRWAAIGVQRVVTTSPVLRQALCAAGVPRHRVAVLPCCLEAPQERLASRIADRRRRQRAGAGRFRVLYIGRLDSYKRVDWLIDAFAASGLASGRGELHIVGDGPLRDSFERRARALDPAAIRFHGRLSERRKQALLTLAALLVLPADRSNEAFGIVQLEAMACGVPCLAFRRSRSGMAWVSRVPALGWSGSPADLAAAMAALAADPQRHRLACEQSRARYLRLFRRERWQQALALALPGLAAPERPPGNGTMAAIQ